MSFKEACFHETGHYRRLSQLFSNPKPSIGDLGMPNPTHPLKKGYSLLPILGMAVLSLSLGACATKPTVKSEPVPNATNAQSDKGFLGLFKPGSGSKSSTADANIGVNAYLWRASLDTLSFMSIRSADPWGGVIITEWYSNPQKPDERFKVDVYILDTRLRADALSVSVFKETQGPAGWQRADVSGQTQIDIENAILTRARELRLSDVR